MLLTLLALWQSPKLVYRYEHLRIDSRWQINIAWFPEPELLTPPLCVRILDRRHPKPAKPLQFFKLGFGPPRDYHSARIRGSSIYVVIGEVQTEMNSFSMAWLFDARTGKFKLCGKDLLNLDFARAKHGLLLESSGSQYVDRKEPGWQEGMIERTWRIDTKSLELKPSRWRTYRY